MNEQPESRFHRSSDVLLSHPLPSSEEAEKAILGAILLDNGLMVEVLESLRPDDFYSNKHAKIFGAMLSLFDRMDNIDPIMIGEELKRSGDFQAVGGVSYISNLTLGLPSLGIEGHIKHVRDASDSRKLIKICNDIIVRTLDREEPIDDLVERAESSIYNVRAHVSTTRSILIKDAIESEIQTAQIKKDQDSVVIGSPTGFVDLDFKLQGLRKQEQVVIAARPSIGKTALALRMLYSIARRAGSVLFFSLEMSKEEISGRIICSEGDIDTYLWRAGKLTDLQWSSAELVRKCISENRGFYIYDSPFVSLRTVRTEIRRVNTELAKQRKPPLVAVAIDHIGLMENETSERGRTRERELAVISQKMKQIARQFNLTTILLSQLNRMSEVRTGHRPMMSDLRESGSIEQDADVAILLYREDVYQDDVDQHTNIAEVIVGKNRNGPTGTVKLHYAKKSTRFANLDEAPGTFIGSTSMQNSISF